jgi:serine/threonine protein kinase
LSVLGKGTYGEVHKCVHTPTGLIVAMKTYMFEVSKIFVISATLERDKRNQLFNNERNQPFKATGQL